jgi:hypothetical protein
MSEIFVGKSLQGGELADKEKPPDRIPDQGVLGLRA